MTDFFDKSYYESGPQSGKSLYQNFRWIPELTIPLAHHIVKSMGVMPDETVMDFGCAKGYLVQALRLLGIEAYGVDISEYAISQATKETSKFVKQIQPLSDDFVNCTHVVCKDILEHIDYSDIDKQLEILRAKCDNILVIVPLAKDNKYIITAYELDKSHVIREDKDWWKAKFNKHGFYNISVTTELGPFKQNWADVNSEGNLLIVGA
jgi:2-polyprenyl-3-methyl-5-hydroxy-6-metoxy-1,4-benzoquinol methylase